jgi:uncharacterized protein (DUF1015 family)
MPDLRPFRGIVYNTSAVPAEEVVCPPVRYLTPPSVESFHLRHPHNAVHLLWPESNGRAAELMESWRREGVVTREQEPAFYVLSQSYRNALGVMVQRFGLVALCRLSEFSAGVIIPHQRTLPALLESSVRRLQRLNAHLQPVTLLAEDADQRLDQSLREAAAGEPLLDFVFDEVIIRLWKVADPAWIARTRGALESQPLLLGSGHHDYEGALTYRDMMRLRTRGEITPFDFIPVLITGMREETVLLRPVIRLVTPGRAMDWDTFLGRLSAYFHLSPAGSLLELSRLPVTADRHAFGIIGADRLLLAEWMGSAPLAEITDDTTPPVVRDLNISILHHFILGTCLNMDDILQQRLEHVSYARELPEAAGAVQRGEAAMALITAPLTLDQLRRLMRSRGVVPPATTALAPLTPCGLIMHRLDEVTA